MRAVRTFVFAAVSVLLFAASAAAQTEMRYYVVPRSGTGQFPTPYEPKYFNQFADPSALPFVGTMDYGLENVFLVAADLTPAQHTAVTANADVLAVPSPIDANVSALALPTVQAKLEAGNIPADWVTTAMTYQQVLSRVLRLVTLMQRFNGLFGRLFAGGATLDTRINQLPVNARNALVSAAQSLGADTSTIQGTTLLRTALVIVADQLFPSGLPFGGVTF
jgi:hypothetical protein